MNEEVISETVIECAIIILKIGQFSPRAIFT